MPYRPELTITNDSYVGNDLYVKHVTVAGNGPVYATIYACFDPPGDPFGVSSIINYCDNGALDPVGDDCVHVGMPYRSVAQSPGQAVITAYPYFAMTQGAVSTMFQKMHSPQFNNYRDINVYVPTSLQQNGVRRKVNVLVVNDGTPFYMQKLAFAGGFDRAVLTGAVPETIMVGLPQNATGCERQLELTFSKGVATNARWCPQAGGNAKYFAFIQTTVVPAVLANLNLIIGEVSITGASYGGLTSCYAASALPKYFQRAFCQSPSVNWNYGQLEGVIMTNAKQLGLPKSVVMYIGTTEMEAPQFANPERTKTVTWYYWIEKIAAAWRAAGLDSSNFSLFTVSGGQHDSTAWATAFSEGIIQMYTPGFTAPFQEQYAAGRNLNVIFPKSPAPGTASTASTSTSTTTPIVVVVAVSIISLVGSWLYVRENYVRKDALINPLTEPLYVEPTGYSVELGGPTGGGYQPPGR